MRKLTAHVEDKMKALGWYQICGGVLGIIFFCYSLYYEGMLTGANLLIYIFILALLSFSIYCGILLINKNSKGFFFSELNQACQVLQIGVWKISYLYFSGIAAIIGFGWGDKFTPDAYLSLTSASIQITAEETPVLIIGINLVPIIIIYWISKIKNEIQERVDLLNLAADINIENKSQ